jgi:hypothetical protein
MCISFWVPQSARVGKYAKETMSIARKFRRLAPLRFDVARPVVEFDLSNRVMLAPGYYPANPSFVDTDGGRLVCIRGVNYRIAGDFRLTPTFTNGDSYHSINRFALLDRAERSLAHCLISTQHSRASKTCVCSPLTERCGASAAGQSPGPR